MKRFIPLISYCLLAVVSTLSIYLFVTRERSAYFDYNDAYNSSSLKKKLEKDLETVVQLRKRQLDSMQLELTFLSQRIQSGTAADQATLSRFEDEKSRYLTYQEEFEEENTRLKETYFNQIRKDINDRSRAFAKEKGYTFLFAAMGDGALMYADDSKDVTKEFTDYINR